MKTKPNLAVLFAFLAFSCSCFGQSWDFVYDSIGSAGKQIILTDDSCYAVTGTCSVFPNGMTLKLDLAGNTIWTSPNGAGSIVQTHDHKYILAGGDYPYAALKKISETGDLLWTRSYGAGLQEGFSGVIESSDSCLVVCGYTRNHGDSTFLVMKTNSLGDVLWTHCFYSMNYNLFNDLIEFDHHYYAVGHEADDTNIPNYLFIVKFTEQGTIVWQRYIETRCSGNSIDLTNDSLIIVAGGTRLAKLTLNGDTVWTSAFSPGWRISSIDVTPSNGYIVSGYDGLYTSVNLLSELDPEGGIIWYRTFPTYSEFPSCNFISVKCTNDGGFITAGHSSYNYGRSTIRMRIIKTDSTGSIIVHAGSDPELPQFQIYPNPCDGRFFINTSGRIDAIEIYNFSGKWLRTLEYTGSVDLSCYESGIYILRLVTDDGVFSQKIIKK